jgi:hypothetical protein
MREYGWLAWESYSQYKRGFPPDHKGMAESLALAKMNSISSVPHLRSAYLYVYDETKEDAWYCENGEWSKERLH